MATKQSDLKPKCKYGAKCYRKNAGHLKNYGHPKRKAESEDDEVESEKVEQEMKKKRVEVETEVEKSTTSEEKTGEEIDEKREETKDETRDDSASDTEEEDEEDDMVSEGDFEAFIKARYMVDMPQDFYKFWQFCEEENSTEPREALKSTLGFTLVGPYDILAGKHKGVATNNRGKKPNLLRHWRYYYDPPEFMTVIRGDDETQFHIGYYRDDPKEMPSFLASNSAKSSHTLAPKGDNIFAAVNFYLKDKVKSKDASSSEKKSAEGLLQRLGKWANDLDLSLEVKSKSMKARQKKVVCDTFHAAGIVVPVDEHEVGYRPVPETPGDLKKILKKIVESKTETERNKNFDPLQELITLVQFANDECDYGEGLELGIDLFSYGGKVFHSTILHLLPLAYQLLRRNPYGKIISAHLRHRKHTADLSELE